MGDPEVPTPRQFILRSDGNVSVPDTVITSPATAFPTASESSVGVVAVTDAPSTLAAAATINTTTNAAPTLMLTIMREECPRPRPHDSTTGDSAGSRVTRVRTSACARKLVFFPSKAKQKEIDS